MPYNATTSFLLKYRNYNSMSDPKLFMEALTILVQRVKEQGFGPDEVMKILAEQGAGGEEGLRAVVVELFRQQGSTPRA